MWIGLNALVEVTVSLRSCGSNLAISIPKFMTSVFNQKGNITLKSSDSFSSFTQNNYLLRLIAERSAPTVSHWKETVLNQSACFFFFLAVTVPILRYFKHPISLSALKQRRNAYGIETHHGHQLPFDIWEDRVLISAISASCASGGVIFLARYSLIFALQS